MLVSGRVNIPYMDPSYLLTCASNPLIRPKKGYFVGFNVLGVGIGWIWLGGDSPNPP